MILVVVSEDRSGIGGGTIAGIVVPLLLLPILIVLICLFVKNKKKRYNQGGREMAYSVYCEYHHRFLFDFISQRKQLQNS